MNTVAGSVSKISPPVSSLPLLFYTKESFSHNDAGQFLGYDPDDSLRTMPHHLGCESFCVRMVSKGFVLLMMENAELMPIKCKNIDDGVQMLEKVRAPASEGLAWEFEEIKSI